MSAAATLMADLPILPEIGPAPVLPYAYHPPPVPPYLYDPVDRTLQGSGHFRMTKYHKYPELYQKLKEGQWPKFLVFACSDSRVSPSHVLDFQPGEAFMVRNIANLVPQFDDKLRNSGVGAAIEYAVKVLEVTNILVIGHSSCGGIKRLMTYPEDGSPPFDFIDDWVKIASPAKDKVKECGNNLSLDEQLHMCEHEAVKLSLKNLLSYPYVKEAVERGTLTLRGGYYDIGNGTFKYIPRP